MPVHSVCLLVSRVTWWSSWLSPKVAGSIPEEVVENFHLLNFLKPTGHVMHQQFNIQQLYVLPTLYLYVLYLSENKQRLVPLTA